MLSNFPSGRRLDLGWPWDEIDWFICLFAIFVHHGLSACLGLCSQAVTVSDSQCLSLSHSQEKVKFYYVMFKLFGCRHAIKMYKQQICETIKEPNYIFCFFVLTFCAFGSYSLLTFLCLLLWFFGIHVTELRHVVQFFYCFMNMLLIHFDHVPTPKQLKHTIVKPKSQNCNMNAKKWKQQAKESQQRIGSKRTKG